MLDKNCIGVDKENFESTISKVTIEQENENFRQKCRTKNILLSLISMTIIEKILYLKHRLIKHISAKKFKKYLPNTQLW